MKKFFTLITLLALASTQTFAQDELQFADAKGNIIADGTVINCTTLEDDGWGGGIMPSGLFVKNTTSGEVMAATEYTIVTLENGSFQTCFPENCVAQTATGTYQSNMGAIPAGVLKSMQTEWLPEAGGTAVVEMQFLIYKYNSITKKYTLKGRGPKVTLNFSTEASAIDHLRSNTQPQSTNYYGMDGRKVTRPVNGTYVVQEHFRNGAVRTTKKLYKATK